ncbi:hypothetical protein [Vibrio coralliilyticus]|uniref:hypothetical protein n=1 Tax=Vibrio coralliilyticus TaxID=190893 RepID=UPI000BAAD822|nr:hypothetical protein [Vibrio coralliilyticus]NOI60501.1 hypothetical protein [Vibrio coralliilyticus]PAT67306.1 hypothetical protein CKA27_15800 [Vibrio coralliilyticus]
MEISQVRDAVRRHAYKNYITLFKGFIVTFGVLLAGWGQMYPHLDANTIAAKEAELYLEQQYQMPFTEVDCLSQPEKVKECRMAVFRVDHHTQVNRFFLFFFSLLFGISITLLLISVSGYFQHIKSNVE